jgi:hypothetical protein
MTEDTMNLRGLLEKSNRPVSPAYRQGLPDGYVGVRQRRADPASPGRR